MSEKAHEPRPGALQDTTRLEILYEILQAASTSLDPREVCVQVTHTLARLGGYPVVGVAIKIGDEFRQVAAAGLPEKFHGNPYVGIHGRVMRTGEPQFVRDVSRDPDYLPARHDATSEICVPVKVAGEILSILDIESTADHPLTDEDFQLVLALADQIGLVMRNALLHQEVLEARAEESHRQATILASVREPIVATDLEGIITYWNRGAERLFGWTAAEVTGQPVSEYLSANKGEGVQGRIRQARQGQSFFGEYEDLAQDGRSIWVEARISQLHDRQGNPAGTIIVYRDITARKRAETEREEQQLRLRSLLDTTPDIVIFKDRDHVFLACSKAKRQHTNRSMEEMIGITDFDIFPPDQAQRFHEEERQVMETGQPLISEHLLDTPQGERWYEAIKTPLSDANGNIAGILCSERDITDRKTAGEQIKATLEEKEVLLQEVHHRVKNNLQVISSLLALQCDYIKDPQILAMFQESRDRVKSMALVHEKLYQSPDLGRIAPADYINSLVTHLFRAYGAVARGIRHKVEAGDMTLSLDSAIPCGLIINELVSNSLKHAFPADQGGEVCVGLHETEEHNLVLTVGDSGTGLPGEFDFHNTKSLGLQLVMMLVRQLEGRIELDGREGTQFTITFPDQPLPQ
jgi:PAS domain S-box-containing protein